MLSQKTPETTMECEGRSPEKKPGGWKCMPYIIGNETFERVATFGLTANFTVYLMKQYGMDQVAAANMSNIFSGTANFMPLLGAFLSDAYLGRFHTLAGASVVTLLGMVVLTLTALIPGLRAPSCSDAMLQASECTGPSKFQLGVLILSLGLLSIGAGGVRPCGLPFGVDQFDRETEDGRRGLDSFYNWYYATSNAAMVVTMTVMVYIQDKISWSIGFGIPTGLMFLAILLFFLGAPLYVYVPPEGSVFSGIVQVFVAAFRKRALQLPAPDDAWKQQSLLHNLPVRSTRILKLPLTLQFRCLNKSAIVCEEDLFKEDGTPAEPWRLCSVQRVEEVKCLMRIVPIWTSSIFCFVAMSQQWTFAVFQSLRMDRRLGSHFEIPPASFGIIAMLTITLFIPVYDRLLVPVLFRVTKIEGGITLLQRQGLGLALSALSMVVAGQVEERRRSSAVAHGGVDGSSPMSALWLAPQMALMGVAEALNAVGQIEFYNKEFPEHMQTLAGSLFFCSMAGAGYMSSFLVSVVHGRTSWLDNNINIGRVDYFYYVIAATGAVNIVYFIHCARRYRYKGTPEVKEGMPESDEEGTENDRIPLLQFNYDEEKEAINIQRRKSPGVRRDR